MISAAVERCAGIDVGKKWLSVCILTGPLEEEPRIERQRFGVNVVDLEQLRDWLLQKAITHVVMESTGSYWKPVFNVLEEHVKVYLANPHEVKARKGHKTDDKDGWWLAHLLRHAMIHPSFIPPRPIRELRDLTRRRSKLNAAGTAEKNRVQKILEDANVKLGNVLSDVFGTSGQLMLDALLMGKAKPEQIAQLARGLAKKKIPAIAAALEGHQMREHHRKMIRYGLAHMKFLEEQIEEIDQEIATRIEQAGLEPQWQSLQTVPGVQQRSAANMLAEMGADMTQFPNERHLSSWAGVCPGNNRSAGKNRSSRTTGGNPWLRGALTECAWAAAAKKDCFIREKFWRMITKSAGKKNAALVAVAHTILRLAYDVLRTGQPYQDRHAPPLSTDHKERLIRHHVRRLGKLGVRVHSLRPPSSPSIPSSTPKKRGRPRKIVPAETNPTND
jgi:transposase